MSDWSSDLIKWLSVFCKLEIERSKFDILINLIDGRVELIKHNGEEEFDLV